MKYVNASSILPDYLIEEIQKYIQGTTIYIPKLETEYQQWGTCSGGRKLLNERNASIRHAFHNGSKINELAQQHYLSVETIKKIVYSK